MPAYCFTGIHCIDRYSIIIFNIILTRMYTVPAKFTILFIGLLLIFVLETTVYKNRKHRVMAVK